MIDVVCLVADKNMEAALGSILARPEALGIRGISYEIIVHPNRDPGCYYQATGLLQGYRDRAAKALVVLDCAWEGSPANTGAELEKGLEDSLCAAGLGDWAHAVAIDPELEAWVFSDSPHVATALGWEQAHRPLREALASCGLWPAEAIKPNDPKAAIEWALREVRKPRSSSIYRALGQKVSLQRCEDRSFLRLNGLLASWFGVPNGTDREDQRDWGEPSGKGELE